MDYFLICGIILDIHNKKIYLYIIKLNIFSKYYLKKDKGCKFNASILI